jgi:agmatine deiminase
MPPEWAHHEACLVALPHLVDEWGPDLAEARRELATLCRAIADPDDAGGPPRGERLEVLVPDAAHEVEARALLGPLPARFHRLAYGDIWVRDTAPLLMAGAPDGAPLAVRFRFNGWGGKYDMPGDADLAERLTATLGLRGRRPWTWCAKGAPSRWTERALASPPVTASCHPNATHTCPRRKWRNG